MRRRALDVCQGRDTRYRFVSDLDFWLRLGLHGPFARIPLCLATWRNHPEALSQSERGERMAMEQVQVVESLFARTNVPSWLPPLRSSALAAAHHTAGVVLMDSSPSRARQHFLRSARLAPATALSRGRGAFTLAALLLPPMMLQPAREFRRALRRRLSQLSEHVAASAADGQAPRR